MLTPPPLPEGNSVQEAIRTAQPWLSPAMQRIASVILEDTAAAVRSTSAEIASRAKTSAATVTRFCAALGIDSFQDLVRRLAHETGRQESDSWSDIEVSLDIDIGGGTSAMAMSVAAAAMRGIRLSAENVDGPALERAATAIAGAGRVDVYGVGGSGSVAAVTEQRLFRIGVPVRAWTDVHGASTSACLLGSDDVAIAISDSGSTKETHEALHFARLAGATTIAITCDPRSPIARAAEISLTAVLGAGDSGRTRTLASRHAQLFVIDCLYVLVTQLSETRARKAVERTTPVGILHMLPEGRSAS